MIVYEIYKNGELLCRAGRNDLDMLTTNIMSSCIEGCETVSRLSANGFVGGENKDKHPSWLESENLSIGDEITIKIVESKQADLPISENEMSENDYNKKES